MKKTTKTIGKTTSGKLVYSDPDHPRHRNFSASDHLEASMMHHTLAKKEMGRYSRNFDVAEQHNELALVHERKAFNKENGSDLDGADHIIRKS